MPDYRIEPMPAQLSAALVTKLLKVETATVGHSQHWGFMDRRIQPLLPRRRIAGPAVTLAIPGQDSTLLHHTLGLLRPGDILVVDRLGDDKHACWGGGVTVAAKAAGAAGGIVDGPCTDLTEIQDSDFPMWCRGMSPITTRLYNLGGTLNLPISCGNVTVKAGDVIIADESGVLVLPPDEAEAIADAAIARQERGEKTQDRVKAGEKLGDISGATKMVLEAMKAAS
ncbi:RraA family protein [Terrarubrum flagellatum]|uniref:RraA family protein n=1 Tax=Terrirubrum flagellatum TaxID=2895980 RepID=UPI00314500F3